MILKIDSFAKRIIDKDNKVDVSIIAKEFGGGGHKNASGFATKINPTILFN